MKTEQQKALDKIKKCLKLAACSATQGNEAAETIHLGKRVRVNHQQARIGGPKCPGRTGTVSGVNGCDENLLYVDLEPTSRAKARTEAFWLKELEFIDPVLMESNHDQ